MCSSVSIGFIELSSMCLCELVCNCVMFLSECDSVMLLLSCLMLLCRLVSSVVWWLGVMSVVLVIVLVVCVSRYVRLIGLCMLLGSMCSVR